MTAHLNLTPHAVTREDRADGTILLRSDVPMGRVARCTGEWLDRWAAKIPNAVFLAATAAGSAGRVTAAIVLAEPASIADGEATEKGNINFPRFLTRRAAVVDRLFDGDASDVLRILQ